MARVPTRITLSKTLAAGGMGLSLATTALAIIGQEQMALAALGLAVAGFGSATLLVTRAWGRANTEVNGSINHQALATAARVELTERRVLAAIDAARFEAARRAQTDQV